MHNDRTKTKQTRDDLGNLPMQFGGFSAHDSKLFTKPDALDRAMGPKVLVAAHRMRGARG